MVIMVQSQELVLNLVQMVIGALFLVLVMVFLRFLFISVIKIQTKKNE